MKMKLDKGKDMGQLNKKGAVSPSPDRIIGYYGSPGSYSEEAAILHFGRACQREACDSFEDLVIKLLDKKIDFGVLPVENSSTGTIAPVMDLIRDNRVYIIGEHISRIRHQLLGLAGARLEDIKTVYSHQQGLDQSAPFLKKYPWEQIAYQSTASSARLVSELGDKTKAAVASKACASLYGLQILAEDIHYNDNNYTRFICIGREPLLDETCNKISLVMDIAHRPGSLYAILGLFNEQGLNLMKIESRPIIGKPWEYLFFFDLEGNLADDRVKDLLRGLENGGHAYRVLGNYRAHRDANNSCL